MDPKFEDTSFKLGYLIKQNAGWALLGRNMNQFRPSSLVKDTDEIFIVAYPTFNPRGELHCTVASHVFFSV